MESTLPYAPRVRVLAVGGTIDKVYFDAKSDYEIGEPQAGAILHEAGVSFDFTVESVLRKDSLAKAIRRGQTFNLAVVAGRGRRMRHGTQAPVGRRGRSERYG